jgi:hypothetical protein
MVHLSVDWGALPESERTVRKHIGETLQSSPSVTSASDEYKVRSSLRTAVAEEKLLALFLYDLDFISAKIPSNQCA